MRILEIILFMSSVITNKLCSTREGNGFTDICHPVQGGGVSGQVVHGLEGGGGGGLSNLWCKGVCRGQVVNGPRVISKVDSARWNRDGGRGQWLVLPRSVN